MLYHILIYIDATFILYIYIPILHRKSNSRDTRIFFMILLFWFSMVQQYKLDTHIINIIITCITIVTRAGRRRGRVELNNLLRSDSFLLCTSIFSPITATTLRSFHWNSFFTWDPRIV